MNVKLVGLPLGGGRYPQVLDRHAPVVNGEDSTEFDMTHFCSSLVCPLHPKYVGLFVPGGATMGKNVVRKQPRAVKNVELECMRHLNVQTLMGNPCIDT